MTQYELKQGIRRRVAKSIIVEPRAKRPAARHLALPQGRRSAVAAVLAVAGLLGVAAGVTASRLGDGHTTHPDPAVGGCGYAGCSTQRRLTGGDGQLAPGELASIRAGVRGDRAPWDVGDEEASPTGASNADPDASGATTTTSTTTSTTTTTTMPMRVRDHDPPEITQLRAGGEIPDGPDEIFDDSPCGATAISIEAVVVDQSALRSVTVHWTLVTPDEVVTGSARMHRDGGKHLGTLGPLPRSSAASGGRVLVRWWVEAEDQSGNTATGYPPDGSGDLGDDERVTLIHCDT